MKKQTDLIPPVALFVSLLTCPIGWAVEPLSVASNRESTDSRAWFILSQTDTNGLFFGLQERLSGSVLPSRRESDVWRGTDEGAIVNLTFDVDASEKGEVFVGFFKNPQWWVAEPEQVRRFPGPGQYATNDLLPGKYYVGAMLVSGGKRLLGVGKEWPNPTVLNKGESSPLHIRISDKFRNQPFGATTRCKQGFMGEWDKVDPTHLVTVQTVDTNGDPVPFCRVTFSERRRDNPDKIHRFHDVGTDAKGYAYLDKIDGKFSVSAQRFDFLPQQFAARYQRKRDSTIHDAKERPVIRFVLDEYPTAEGSVSGKVYDQHGKPLKEYYITLTRWAYGEPSSNENALSHANRIPVTDLEGSFSVNKLPIGEYKVRIRHFDYVTHVWSFNNAEFEITDETLHPTIDIEVEAKQLFFANVVDQDDRPISKGYWRVHDVGMYEFEGGLVRVALSKEELANLKERNGRVEIRTIAGEDVNVDIESLSTDHDKPTRLVIDVTKNKSDSAPDSDSTAETAPQDRPQVTPEGGISDFALLDCRGNTIRLSDFTNQPVLLNFFATWCGPCQLELPKLAEIQKKYEKTGLVVLAVSSEADSKAVEDFARRHRFPFEIALDVEGEATAQLYASQETRSVPLTVVLDRTHRIAFRQNGYSDEKHAELLDALPRAIGSE